MPTAETELAGLVNKYLLSLQLKNYSVNTITDYRNRLRYFLHWCTQQNIRLPAEVQKETIELYSKYLEQFSKKSNKQTISQNTRQMYLSAVCKFFWWLTKNYVISYNPAGEIPLPKTLKCSSRDVLTHQQAELVLNQTDVTTDMGLRDRAILEILYSSGIRRSELANLTIHDVDTINGTILVREGKGRKDRLIPVGERACCWIEKYLGSARINLNKSGNEVALFLNGWGKPLSALLLSRLVHKYILMANVGKSGGCHLFRHTFATVMLENGADSNSIQKILGHSSAVITQIYTSVSISKLKTVYQNTHPIERERNND